MIFLKLKFFKMLQDTSLKLRIVKFIKLSLNLLVFFNKNYLVKLDITSLRTG